MKYRAKIAIMREKILKLDSSKANSRLNWKPVWDFDECIQKTTNWYKLFNDTGEVVSTKDLESFVDAILGGSNEYN